MTPEPEVPGTAQKRRLSGQHENSIAEGTVGQYSNAARKAHTHTDPLVLLCLAVSCFWAVCNSCSTCPSCSCSNTGRARGSQHLGIGRDARS